MHFGLYFPHYFAENLKGFRQKNNVCKMHFQNLETALQNIVMQFGYNKKTLKTLFLAFEHMLYYVAVFSFYLGFDQIESFISLFCTFSSLWIFFHEASNDLFF